MWINCCNNDLPEPGTDSGSGPNPSACVVENGKELRLTTEDGVELKAVHYSNGVPGARSVVLLHMIPPRFDLNNYTPEFIQTLRDRGFDVINVNRRGAKGSQGNAQDAYEGPKGWLDAKAGVEFLLDSPCKNPGTRMAMIGASNGSTTMIDYNIHAQKPEHGDLPAAQAMVFLSGGSYTENQHRIGEQLGALGSIPAYFAYPTEEAEWNLGIQKLASKHEGACWKFEEFSPGAHGTFLFETDPGIMKTVAGFLDKKVR